VRVFISAELGKDLKEKLLSSGYEVIDIPLITAKPLPFSLNRFEFDYAVFSSKNGVRFFFSSVDKERLNLKTVVAVGKSTASYLQTFGYSPIYPENFSAEGLVSLFKNVDLKGKKFLLIKGDKGRKLFSEFLKGKGAEVYQLTVYETSVNEGSLKLLEKELAKGFDFFCFTSPSNFRAFWERFKNTFKFSSSSKIVPIGHVTKKAVESEGLESYKLPKEYTLEGIVKLLLEEVKC